MTAGTYDSVHYSRRFLAPGGESTSAEGFVVDVVVAGGGGANVPDWSTSSNWVPWQREGEKHLIKQIFIM